MKRILLLAALTGTLILPIRAQGPARYVPAPGAVPGLIDPATGLPVPPKIDQGPKFDLNFPGGSPSDLIEAIEKASGQRPNVVIHPECKNLLIPPFRLREVSAYQLFMTMNTLNQGMLDTGSWQRVPLDQGDVWTLLPQNKSGGPQFGAFSPPAQPVRPAPNCKVFNLAPYLDKYTVEDITTAIQGAWDLMKLETVPSIKYHKDTKLLIVVGYVNELNVIADVLRELDRNLDPKPKAEKAAASDSNKEAKPASKF